MSYSRRTCISDAPTDCTVGPSHRYAPLCTLLHLGAALALLMTRLHPLPLGVLLALLVELVLHKQVTLARLERLTGLSRPVLVHELHALERMGLVSHGAQSVLAINRYVHPMVVAHLRERGVLR